MEWISLAPVRMEGTGYWKGSSRVRFMQMRFSAVPGKLCPMGKDVCNVDENFMIYSDFDERFRQLNKRFRLSKMYETEVLS